MLCRCNNLYGIDKYCGITFIIISSPQLTAGVANWRPMPPLFSSLAPPPPLRQSSSYGHLRNRVGTNFRGGGTSRLTMREQLARLASDLCDNCTNDILLIRANSERGEHFSTKYSFFTRFSYIKTETVRLILHSSLWCRYKFLLMTPIRGRKIIKSTIKMLHYYQLKMWNLKIWQSMCTFLR